MNAHYRGLAFLLSIGSLPLACTKDDNETDGGSTTAGTGPNDTTGVGDDATDPTTGASVSSSATTDNSGTGSATGGNTTTSASGTTGQVDTGDTEPQPTTFLTTNTDSGTGFETEDPPLPPPTDPVCIAYAEHIVACFPMYSGYQDYLAQYCELYKSDGLRTDGQACADAFDAYYVCLSKVDCAEFIQGRPGPCPAEAMALFEACPSFNEPGETTTDGGSGGSETGNTGG